MRRNNVGPRNAPIAVFHVEWRHSSNLQPLRHAVEECSHATISNISPAIRSLQRGSWCQQHDLTYIEAWNTTPFRVEWVTKHSLYWKRINSLPDPFNSRLRTARADKSCGRQLTTQDKHHHVGEHACLASLEASLGLSPLLPHSQQQCPHKSYNSHQLSHKPHNTSHCSYQSHDAPPLPQDQADNTRL